ncbi:unnamed protein product, partial [Rotaria sp. Silwood2]
CISKESNDLVLSQIADVIKINYQNQCGIIYCFSRAGYDRVGNRKNKRQNKNLISILAQYLLADNIHALSYHADLNDSLRQTINIR